MKLKLKLMLALVLCCSALTATAVGDYELATMSEEICHDYGQKAVNAYGARKKGVPNTKVLNHYREFLEKKGPDGELARQVINFGYDEATSVNQAGMRGWAMCKDSIAEMVAVEKAKYR